MTSMNSDYERLFHGLNVIEPPQRLYEAILQRIEFERRRAARFRLTFFALTALASFMALIPALQYLAADFYQSGFYQYVSIIFSDGSLTLTYWKDFTLLLADSFPVTATGLVLASLLIFLGSLRAMISKIRPAFSLTKLA